MWIIQPTQVPKHPKMVRYFGICHINVYQNMRNKMEKKIVHKWWSRESGFSAYGTTQGREDFPAYQFTQKPAATIYVTVSRLGWHHSLR